jgi:hypothetical protein
MKSLTVKRLIVVVAMVLWVTPSLAMDVSNVPVGTPEQTDKSRTMVSPSAALLYALSGLDTESLAEQEMTDQELRGIVGEGIFDIVLSLAASSGSSEYITFEMSHVYISGY